MLIKECRLGAQGSLWERRDGEVVLSLVRLVEGGCLRCHAADPVAAGALLPRAVHALVPQLAAEQDGVRFGVSQVQLACQEPTGLALTLHIRTHFFREQLLARHGWLRSIFCSLYYLPGMFYLQAIKNLLVECLDDELVLAAVAHARGGRGSGSQLPPATSVVAAISSTLTARYQDSWHLALPGKDHNGGDCIVALIALID